MARPSCRHLLGAVCRHEAADLSLGLGPNPAPSPHLLDEVTIAEGIMPKSRRAHGVRGEERLDVGE
jgi:hypothetical protein